MSDSKIRNFCIIAHIDHGKSTLADRLIEMTNTVQKRDMKAQMLDTMDIEQERGITIKLQPVRMEYTHPNGEKYILNLIDTPGHVDFTYEVSRSLAACDGAILVVDATQGIEAQTLANTYLALEHNLEVIPVMNKIDLPSADPDRIGTEIENTFGIPREEILAISAKEGTNVDKLLQVIVEKVPPTKIPPTQETKALIFDSVYDQYKGVLAYARVFEGSIKRGDKVTLLNTKTEFDVLEVGYFKPKYMPCDEIKTGEVGYVVTGLKSVGEARVGDTIWQGKNMQRSEAIPLDGYRKVTPFVYASIFCTENDDYPDLRDALEKLSLNDSALEYEPEQSKALGFGFRCGFLGLLHLEIVQERLEREYNLDLIVTAPSVSYQVVLKNREERTISSPSELPDPSYIDYLREPWIKTEIIVPKDFVGAIMKLCQDRRGLNKNIQYIDENRVLVIFEMPLANVIIDFFDQLKSVSSGYASMSYEFLEYRREDLIKMDIIITGEIVDALAIITHRTEAQNIGSRVCTKLKEVIPKQQFEIAIQAAIGGRIIARETVKALRKDVTAKLYGGDRTRKDKLLKKQKAGKKRLKQIGKVTLPQEAFMAILKRD